ncbi:calcium-activated chloride channel regulator 1-like [Tigriopus californicus]|uniref:calcium-activated chloride channel regulator 1-like n=1 Tax=Tigriopus californicus TaxID=6832 RepID=UPI0027DA3E4E|nr:calcium-activated chloride channel regulator 1-like [Tigriopus californicus]
MPGEKLTLALWLAIISSVQNEEVFLKIDKNVPIPSGLDCNGALLKLKSFLDQSSTSIHQATGELHQWTKVTLEIPSSWSGCTKDANGTVPVLAAHVIMAEKSMTRAVQPEGCGIRGKQVRLKSSFLTGETDQNQAVRQFVTEWIKYRFGVFDEHGYDQDPTFPNFYRKASQIYPNSCTNRPIKGNFTEDCLENPCSIEPGQAGIETSLLFSINAITFPQMSRVCDETTHDKDAPNLQNLLCDYKSVMEVIREEAESARSLSRNVQFQVVQANPLLAQGQGDLVIIFDNSVQMQGHWTAVRIGLEQLFITMNPNTLVTMIINENVPLTQTRVGAGMINHFWSDRVFPETLPTSQSFELRTSFNTLKNQMSILGLWSPTIVVLTATPIDEAEDWNSTITWVKENRLSVDVMTVPQVKTRKLVELTQFGNLYALPLSGTDHDRGALAGAILMAMVEHIEGINFQQIAQVVKDPLSDNWVHGHFEVQSDMTSKEAPKFQVLVLSPWNLYPQVNMIVEAPNGTKWQTSNNSIYRVWSSHVLQLKPDGFGFQSGTWKFSIQGPGSSFSGKIHVMAFVDVGTKPIGRSFFQSNSKLGLNATDDTFAVSVFTSLEQVTNMDQNWTVKAKLINGFTSTDLILKDDGLIVPDVMKKDHLHSQYFFDIKERGFYSTQFELWNENGIQRFWPGPSLFVDQPINNSLSGDRIPPSRIMDLRTSLVRDDLVSLIWTAPGDDLNLGQANFYRIFCGLSREDLSFDDCVAVRSGLVRFSHEAGTREEITFPLAIIGVPVYFGIKAYDNVGNSGSMSNVAEVFVPGPPTIPTTPSNPDDNPPNGIYISEAGFIALLVILGLLLILVVLVACVYVCLRMRKRRQEKKHEQKALELFMANQRQHQPPKSSQSNVYSDIISSGQKIEQNAPKFKSRTKTKTNGSLSPSLVQHSLPERRHSERSISSSSSSQIGDANQAYIGSPVVQVRKPKSKSTTPAPPPPPPQREVQLSPRQLISNQGRDRRPLSPETLRQMSWSQSMESSSDSDFEPMDVPYQGPPPPIRRHASQTDYSRQFKKPSAAQKAASLNSPQVQQGQPFNYITFSEMLYGDHRRQQPLGSPDLSSSRAVSYVLQCPNQTYFNGSINTHLIKPCLVSTHHH